MACMLSRELKWEEVAPPHKGMIQLKVPLLEVTSYMKSAFGGA